MFQRSGAAKRSVAGILPPSMSTTNQRPSTPLAFSQLTDVAGSNHRLQGGRNGPCVPGEDVPRNCKRTSRHLGRHTAHLKRPKVAESAVKKTGGSGISGGRGGGGREGHRGLGGKGGGNESVGRDGGDGGNKVREDECGTAVLNTSKDQNKLLMSDSSENSDARWNDDSDEDNVGQAYTSPSSFHSQQRRHRGRTELLKKSSRPNSTSKRRQEETMDVDGGKSGHILRAEVVA